jgi:transketolase
VPEDVPEDVPADVTADVTERWHAAGSRGAAARRSWLKRLARHNQRGEFDRVISGRLPDNWHEAVAGLKQDIADSRPTLAGQASSQRCMEILIAATPELIGGSAGRTGSNATLARGIAPIAVGNYGGRYIHYGIRPHGMAAAANGMALHGGIIPYIGTFVAFSDDLRPALRMSAIMRQRVVYVLTYESNGLGEHGPAHQPVEHLASLRAMPNLHVYRPADGTETAECWELAIRRSDGPSLLVLSRQKLPTWRTDTTENPCARGGYVLAEAEGPRQATIIATGSEVPIAMAAREKLAGDNIAVAVVSLPCWELFALQSAAYRAQMLGGAPRVGVEAAAAFGWEQWLGPDGTFIGMNGFGASAGFEQLYAQFGITTDAVVAAVTRRLG